MADYDLGRGVTSVRFDLPMVPASSRKNKNIAQKLPGGSCFGVKDLADSKNVKNGGRREVIGGKELKRAVKKLGVLTLKGGEK